MTQDLQFWDRLYERTGGACQSPFTQPLHEKIREIIPEDIETILDAGCGGGALMAFLAREGKYMLEGVDMSSQGIRYIVEEMHMKAQVGDICDLHQYADNSFDFVVCSEVTEHIPMSNLEKAIAELFRVARKCVITTNPFRERLPYHQVECVHCQTRYHPAGHIHSIDESFLKPLVARHAKSVSFVYSGQREWHSSLYAGLLRTFGYRLVCGLETSCPLCGTEIPSKRWGIPVRLSGYAYRLTQMALKQIGVYRAANIITVAKVK